MKTLLICTGVFLITYANTSFAQSGHPLLSTDMTAGTSVPLNPTDPVRDPEGPNNGAIRLPGASTNDLDKDAGSSKADRKASRKKTIPYQNEPDPLLKPGAGVPY